MKTLFELLRACGIPVVFQKQRSYIERSIPWKRARTARSDDNPLGNLDRESCRPTIQPGGRYFSDRILGVSGSWQLPLAGMSDKSGRCTASESMPDRRGNERECCGAVRCSLCPLTSQPTSFSLARRPVKSVTPRLARTDGEIPRNYRRRGACMCTRRRAPMFANIHKRARACRCATFIYRVCALTSAPFDAVIHRPQTFSIGRARRPNRLDSEWGYQHRQRQAVRSSKTRAHTRWPRNYACSRGGAREKR